MARVRKRAQWSQKLVVLFLAWKLSLSCRLMDMLGIWCVTGVLAGCSAGVTGGGVFPRVCGRRFS